MPFGESRILPHKIAKDTGGRGIIVVLAQDQPQLHFGIDVVRIKTDVRPAAVDGFRQPLDRAKARPRL